MRFGSWVCWVYLERESVIPGATLWSSEVSGSIEVLPDGCMDILSIDGELVLAGSDTSVARVECPEPTRFLGVRFLPGTLPSWLSVNPKDVLNSRVRLSEVLTCSHYQMLLDSVGAQVEQCAFGDEAPGFERGLGEFFRRTMPRGNESRSGVVEAIAVAARSGGSLAASALQLGFSERQLHRICLSAFGYGYATLARVTRFQSAVGRLTSGMSLAAVAAACGYSDQSHMTRDFQALGGASPHTLRARRLTAEAKGVRNVQTV